MLTVLALSPMLHLCHLISPSQQPYEAVAVGGSTGGNGKVKKVTAVSQGADWLGAHVC
jgi:hypothetical protein